MTQKNQEKHIKKEEKKLEQPEKKQSEKMENASFNQAETIKKLEKETTELRDKFMRAYAEMENVKKRSQIEIEKNAKIAIADFALALLPVADNLARALALPIPTELENNAYLKSLFEGIVMTQKELQTALEKNGVKEIESVGKPFDPNFQKAIQEISDPEKPNGTVLQEWQKGYTIGGDRVLREALVIVSRKEE